MEIKKAVITAAGQRQVTLPLQTLVDRDGSEKTALEILIEEVLSAGIEEIGIVVRPNTIDSYTKAAGAHAGRLVFLEQAEARGYGHAIACARPFTDQAAFLLLVSDHLYVSGSSQPCAQQLVELASTHNCAVSAVQATHEAKLPYYGAVGGRLVGGQRCLYEIDAVMEKPTPTEAEQRLVVPGLRAGYYLCFFGMHVMTPTVMQSLEDLLQSQTSQGTPHLTRALAELIGRERYLAAELQGRRYDIGVKYGLLTAQLALALDGEERDEVLSVLVELLASRRDRT